MESEQQQVEIQNENENDSQIQESLPEVTFDDKLKNQDFEINGQEY